MLLLCIAFAGYRLIILKSPSTESSSSSVPVTVESSDSSVPVSIESSNPSVAETITPVKKTNTVGPGLSLEADSDICCYAGDKLLYCAQDTGRRVFSHFLYDTAAKKTANLGPVNWGPTSGDMIWMENGKAYMCPMFYSDGKNQLLEFDLEKRKVTGLEKMTLGMVTVYFEKLSPTEFLFNKDIEEKIDGKSISVYSYYIFNTETKKSRPFLKMQMDVDNNKGKVSIHIRKKDDHLYMLTYNGDGIGESHQAIEVYTLDGRLEEVRDLPASIDKYTDEHGYEQDISDFYMMGDYYYFATDSKGFLCRYDNGKFVELDIPTTCNSLVTPLVQAKKADESQRYAYLLERGDRYAPTMLIFDTQTAKFYRYQFAIDDKYNNVKGIYTDENNNLAVWCSDGDINDTTSKVFFIEQKEIIDNMKSVDR